MNHVEACYGNKKKSVDDSVYFIVEKRYDLNTKVTFYSKGSLLYLNIVTYTKKLS